MVALLESRMDVLVVGGYPSLLQGAYGKKLAEKGIDIRWHEPRGAVLDCIPEACEGVLIIKDLVNHQLAGLAIGHAKAKGIPFVQVTRKFSHALPIIEGSGFLKSVRITSKKAESALSSLVVEDIPTLDNQEPANEDALMITQTDELNEAMDILFLEDPYCTKQPSVVMQRLKDLSGLSCSQDAVDQMCKKRIASLKEWQNKRLDPKQRDTRDAVRMRWLTGYILEYNAANGSFPQYKLLNEEAKTFFGSTIEHTRLRILADRVRADHKVKLLKPDPVPVSVPAPVQKPLIEQKVEEPDFPDRMASHVTFDLLVTTINAQADRIENMAKQLEYLMAEVVASRKLLQEQEQRRQETPIVVTAVPSATPLAQALAELASNGLVISIESKG